MQTELKRPEKVSNANGAKIQTQSEIEEVALEGTPEAAPEKNDPQKELEELRAQMDAEKKGRVDAEAKARDLGSRLTKEQQLRSEWERYHTQTLPQLNKQFSQKPFEDQWAESPEAAVEARVSKKTDPMAQDLARTRAETWMTQIMVSNPKLAKHEQRVVELSLETPELASLTYTRAGIEKLFRLAASEDMEVENVELNKKVENYESKSRAYTESSAPSRSSQTKQTKLTPQQAHVAKMLNVKPEDYLKRVSQVQSIGSEVPEEFDV